MGEPEGKLGSSGSVRGLPEMRLWQQRNHRSLKDSMKDKSSAIRRVIKRMPTANVHEVVAAQWIEAIKIAQPFLQSTGSIDKAMALLNAPDAKD
jgi:hypothetical protein